MSALAVGRKAVGGEERLSREEMRLERLLLGLRMAEGIPAEWVDHARSESFVASGLAERRGDRLALTERGLFLANEAVLELAEQ